MSQVIHAHMPLGTAGVSKSRPRLQTTSYIKFNRRQNSSVDSTANIQTRLKSISLRFERVKNHHKPRHPSAFTTGASNRMHRGLPRRVSPSGSRTNGTINNTSVANSSKLFRVSDPSAMRNQTPPKASDSGLGSPLSSPTSSNNSFKYSPHTHFTVNVKEATYPQLPREIELWERTLGFLAEYLDLLVFFKASGNLRGDAEAIERSFHPYRSATANRILQALISLRDEVVEFPPRKSAVTELEMAYKAWDRLDNSLFVVIWEFNKGSRSP